MKNTKKGFTLAEVLITLAVIGIVAAVTLPTMNSSYQYKTIGTKIAKFVAQTESQAQAYVAGGSELSSDTAKEFADAVFMYKALGYLDNGVFTIITGHKVADGINVTSDGFSYDGNGYVAQLNDGTLIQVISAINGTQDTDKYPESKFGSAQFSIRFFPNVKGIPNSVNKAYIFSVTETGMIIPSGNDKCLNTIYDANFVTNASTFTEENGCGRGNS